MGYYIVTGGASGIGADVAGFLGARGDEVLIWDIGQPAPMAGTAFERLDLSNAADVAAACARVARPVDGFIHCAGIQASTSIAHDNLAAMMDLAYRIHCLSFVVAVQALLDRFAERASIVGVTSAGAEMIYPGSLAYGASKAALQRTITQLAVELGGRGLRVNAVAPGSIATAMTRESWSDPDFAAKRLAHIPLGFQADPSAISDAVAYLTSDAARYVTGQTLWVDGGVRHGMFQAGVRAFMEQGERTS